MDRAASLMVAVYEQTWCNAPPPVLDLANPEKRLGFYALLHGSLATLYVAVSGEASLGFPLDDAYIHQVYAEGIAYGEGLAYNPGTPAAGSTSPMWAIMLALFHRLGMSTPILATKVLGAILGTLTAFAGDAALRTRDAHAALAIGCALAIDPVLVFSSVSGMEVALGCALGAGAVAAFAHDRVRLCGVLLGLAVVTRPELALVVVALGGWHAHRARESNTDAWRRAAWWLTLPSVATLGGWSLWCLHATNRALPTTFYAKHVTDLATQWRDVHWAYVVVLGGTFVGLVLVPLVAVAMRRGWQHRDPLACTLGLLVLAAPLGVAWAHDLAEPDGFYWARYGWVFRPYVWILIGTALAGRFWLRAGAIVLICAAGNVVLVPEYAGNCRNIVEMNVAAADWLRERTHESEWIASNDAGAVRLFGKRRVIDLVGLNDHRVLDGELESILRETQPRYYVIFETWFPRLVQSPQFEVAARFRSDPYTICSECTQPELLILERR